MIPAPQTPEDILTIVRQRNRWSLRQRVIALRAAQRRINVLRVSGKITSEKAKELNQAVLPILAQTRQRYKKVTGKDEPRQFAHGT